MSTLENLTTKTYPPALATLAGTKIAASSAPAAARALTKAFAAKAMPISTPSVMIVRIMTTKAKAITLATITICELLSKKRQYQERKHATDAEVGPNIAANPQEFRIGRVGPDADVSSLVRGISDRCRPGLWCMGIGRALHI